MSTAAIVWGLIQQIEMYAQKAKSYIDLGKDLQVEVRDLLEQLNNDEMDKLSKLYWRQEIIDKILP